MRRRTIALLELGGSGLLLSLLVRFRKRIGREDEPIPIRPSAVALGAIWGVTYLWGYDRDVAGIRTNRKRRILVQLGSEAALRIARRSLSESLATSYNHLLGTLAGSIAYRLWYGLLRPLPGTEA